MIKVVRSKCSTMVGHKGIIILDTKGTFNIIRKDNELKSKYIVPTYIQNILPDKIELIIISCF